MAKRSELALCALLALWAAAADADTAPERLTEDTPRATPAGTTFVAPHGWTVVAKPTLIIIEAPEADSRVAVCDVRGKSSDSAVAGAWAAYRPDARPELKSVTAAADRDGWQDRHEYIYRTPPNARRELLVRAMRAGDTWAVVIYDLFTPTADRRRGEIAVVGDRLLPKGYERESFAGRKANRLDARRIQELSAFIERTQAAFDVPGVAVGIVQDGEVVLERGFGVRERGKPAKVDADTLFMIASTTKAMTTLMLGKVVEAGRLAWDTPVTRAMPGFALGDADTTRQVLIKHLVCACTGLPRQDLEWIFEFAPATPASAIAMLATTQPTTKFGELYQYSNLLAAAGGYVGGHLLYPRLELGAAYDKAMQARVFVPLHMTSTTFDFARARRGNHAVGHARNIDDVTEVAPPEVNASLIPIRPAGGAWSSVHDMLKYVAMETRGGLLPGGKRYVSEQILRDRRARQVAIGSDGTYGMGLAVNTRYGIPIVGHGGSLIGYKSGMTWLPDYGVGAVLLANADTGGAMFDVFRRKLLEVLFDGRPEADADVDARAEGMHVRAVAERKLLTVPPAADAADRLAPRYRNPALGEIAVSRSGTTVVFDFGEWRSPVASRQNRDGTTSFITTVPGMDGWDFVVGAAAGKRTLTLRDQQHEYAFTEQ